MRVPKRAVVFCAALSLAGRLVLPSPPPRSLEGLADMLGRAAGGQQVRPSDIVWEPSPGVLTETFSGRRVLFLAGDADGGPRDLYRAEVRLTLEGRPVSVK